MKSLLKTVLTLIFLIGFAPISQAQIAPEQPVTFLGTYTNMVSSEEHEEGKSILLWQTGDTLIGHMHSAYGMIGDTPTGVLENLQYNPKNGSIEFQSKLTTGFDTDGNPNHDLFKFKGNYNKDKDEITGAFEQFDAKKPETPPIIEKVTLKRGMQDMDEDYQEETFADWQTFTDDILSFRGPQWN